jgi:hypothetical protein
MLTHRPLHRQAAHLCYERATDVGCQKLSDAQGSGALSRMVKLQGSLCVWLPAWSYTWAVTECIPFVRRTVGV